MTLTSATVVLPPDPTSVYVDTNIVHYLGVNGPPPNDDNAVNALSALSAKVIAGVIHCLTSDISLMEQYDTHKGRFIFNQEMKKSNIRFRNTSAYIRNPAIVTPLNSQTRKNAIDIAESAIAAGLVAQAEPSRWPSDLVLAIGQTTDLHWADALHVAIALDLRCDIFLTNDEALFDVIKTGFGFNRSSLHRRVYSVLRDSYGFTSDRLSAPLIDPVLLRDPLAFDRLWNC